MPTEDAARRFSETDSIWSKKEVTEILDKINLAASESQSD